MPGNVELNISAVTGAQSFIVRHQDRTPVTIDVVHVLVASQIQVISNPTRTYCLPGTYAVQEARSDCERSHDLNLCRGARKAPVLSACPLVTSQKTGSDQHTEAKPAQEPVDWIFPCENRPRTVRALRSGPRQAEYTHPVRPEGPVTFCGYRQTVAYRNRCSGR